MLKILIVEDNPIIALHLREIIEDVVGEPVAVSRSVPEAKSPLCSGVDLRSWT